MQRHHVNKFFGLLGQTGKDSNRWVMSNCPYAPVAHSSGKDSKPSFGISVGQYSTYHCFSCGKKGDLLTLVFDLSRLKLLPTAKDCFDFVDAYEGKESLRGLDFSEKESEAELHVYSDSWWQSFPPATNHPYLKSRGVSPGIIKFLDIRFDPIGCRVLFPVRNEHNQLIGVQGRTYTEAEPKYLFIRPKGQDYNQGTILGVSWVDWDKTIVLVEGVFDLIRVLPLYKNALCVFGSKLDKHKFKVLKSGINYLLLFDNDLAGVEGREVVRRKLKDKVKDIYLPKDVNDVFDCPVDKLRLILKPVLLGGGNG